MATGTAKWFSDDEGGFIAPGGGSEDVRPLQRDRGAGFKSLAEEAKVKYEVEGAAGTRRQRRHFV